MRRVCQCLASLYKSKGQYAKVSRCISMPSTSTRGHWVSSIPSTLEPGRLGFAVRGDGGVLEGEPLHLQALAIRKKVLGEQSPEHALSLNNLALLYLSMGKYAKAEQLYLQCLGIRKKAWVSSTPTMPPP